MFFKLWLCCQLSVVCRNIFYCLLRKTNLEFYFVFFLLTLSSHFFLQRFTMLFLSNHQDLATEQHHFLQNPLSPPHPHFHQCPHPRHPNYRPRFHYLSLNLFPAPVSLRPHHMESWVPFQRNLPKPCWRMTKNRRPPVLKPPPSVRFTPSCSRYSLDQPCRCSRYTHTHTYLRRWLLNWCHQCTHRR